MMKNMRNRLRPAKHFLIRKLGLHPIQKTFKRLGQYGIRPAGLHVLELFGGTGDIQLHAYAGQVKRLTIWEIDQSCCETLQKKFPFAEVKCCNTYEAVLAEPRRFDLVICDNPAQPYGRNGEYVEHFGLWPDITRLAEDEAVFILNVLPDLGPQYRTRFGRNLERQFAARRRFYETDRPESIAFEQMRRIYRNKLESAGLHMSWSFLEPKNELVCFFVCGVKRD